MVKIRKYANFIERFLHGEKGQRFFNFAYSIGAAIVIWGALFKILHLPGGSTLLCIGMGTEIAMFILTAFDRPPKEYSWEEVFPVLDTKNPDDRPDFSEGGAGGGIIVTGGAAGAASLPGGMAPQSAGALQGAFADTPAVVADYSGQLQALSEQVEKLQETAMALNRAGETLLNSYRAFAGDHESVPDSSTGYARQMEDLNRNIAGLNTIYEIQLKSVSGQLETIDRVNRSMKDIRDMYEKSANESSRYCEETEKMARYMKLLNAVYEKMITAMTINMQNPMMGAPRRDNPFNEND